MASPSSTVLRLLLLLLLLLLLFRLSLLLLLFVLLLTLLVLGATMVALPEFKDARSESGRTITGNLQRIDCFFQKPEQSTVCRDRSCYVSTVRHPFPVPIRQSPLQLPDNR